MKRRVLLLICAFLSMAIVIVGLQPLHQPPPHCPVDVRPETYKQLKIGMSLDEVEAILGGPAGDYRTRTDISFLFALSSPYLPWGSTKKEWLTDKYAIEVDFRPEEEPTPPQCPAAFAVTSLATPNLASGTMHVFALKRFQDALGPEPEAKVSGIRCGVGHRILSDPELLLNSFLRFF